jgi:pilus assembly protein Flp/PilA
VDPGCAHASAAKRQGLTARNAGAIEYGLIAAGISVAILVAVNSVGTSLTSLFDTVATDLKPK